MTHTAVQNKEAAQKGLKRDVGEKVFPFAGTKCLRVEWHLKRGFPFSEEKRRGQQGKGFVRGTWEERRERLPFHTGHQYLHSIPPPFLIF